MYSFSLFLEHAVPLLLAVPAAVHRLVVAVLGENKDLVEPLLYGSDAAGILAADDISDLLRKLQMLFLDNLPVLYDVNRDVVIDEAQDLQVEEIHRKIAALKPAEPAPKAAPAPKKEESK